MLAMDEAQALIDSTAWKRYVLHVLMPRVLTGYRQVEQGPSERVSGALAELRLLIETPYMDAGRLHESPLRAFEQRPLRWLWEWLSLTPPTPEWTPQDLDDYRRWKATQSAQEEPKGPEAVKVRHSAPI